MTWRHAEIDETTTIHTGQTFDEMMTAWTTPAPSEVFSWAWVTRRTLKWTLLLWGIVVVWATLDNAGSLSRTIKIATHPAWLGLVLVVGIASMLAVENRAKQSKQAADLEAYRAWAEEHWDSLGAIEQEEVVRRLFPTGYPSPLVPIGVAMAIADRN